MGSGNNEISQRCENFLKFTEETLGQAEKTELDAHLANRLGKAESTKQGSEKIMKQTEVTLNPNPDTAVRTREKGWTHIQRIKPASEPQHHDTQIQPSTWRAVPHPSDLKLTLRRDKVP
ncbi:uncharacterized protein [Narcine bancroftii]|uniref:uncharacterized protein isoform X1 n=1 Tax=Narcine bancroftii TaxID=1343680 RepID=UPI003831449B